MLRSQIAPQITPTLRSAYLNKLNVSTHMALPKAASELSSIKAHVASHQVADDQEKSVKRRYTISASFVTLFLANYSFNLRLFPCRTITRLADTILQEVLSLYTCIACQICCELFLILKGLPC